MKNLTKQVLTLLIGISFLFTSSGCENKNNENEVANDFKMQDVDIPSEYKSDLKTNYEEINTEVKMKLEDGTEFKGYMNIKIGKDNKLVGMQLSRNIFDKTENDADFLMQYVNSNNLKSLKGDHADCTTTCEDEAENPGWCKAGCWAETVGKALVGVAAVITVFA